MQTNTFIFIPQNSKRLVLRKKKRTATHLALVKECYGKYEYLLPIIIGKNDIFFVRDKNGVGVYHTGSLPIDDWRVIKIKRVLLPRSRRILV